jgi:hypothetical protein
MSNPLDDLERLRERFLDQLHSRQVTLDGHEALVGYWQLLDQQADVSGDLELLERGVRELARDRDRLRALEGRLEREDHGSGLLAPVLRVIRMLLEALEHFARRFRRQRDARRGQLAALLWLAGPGAIAQLKPDDKDDKQKKDEEQQQQAALLASRQPGKPVVQTPPEQQKKLER